MRRCIMIVLLVLIVLTPSVIAINPISEPYSNTLELPSLKDIYADQFLVGFASGSYLWRDEALVLSHYNAFTAENEMKPASVQPSENYYTFDGADSLAGWAIQNDVTLVGHTLVWHSQSPDWMWYRPDGSLRSRDEGLQIMEEHINTVAGRWAGQVYQWDVVNEAIVLGETPSDLRNSPWLQVIGEDYIEQAFRFAHAADPNALLLYNDYNSTEPAQRDAIYNLAKGLLEKDVPIHGIGLQGHWGINGPSEQRIREAIELYASLGLSINITELDVSVYDWDDRSNLYPDRLPLEVQHKQAEQIAMYFRVFNEYSDVIDRVSFWGITDRNTWLNDYPENNRPNHPLLFDRESQPKPAFWAVVDPYNPWYLTMANYLGAVVFINSDGEELGTLIPGEYRVDELSALGLALSETVELEIRNGFLITFYETDDLKGSAWSQAITPGFDMATVAAKARSFSINHYHVENVALNKPTDASVLPDRAERAVDGDGVTSWATRGITPPYWISVDLGEPHLIDRWVVKWYGSGPIAVGGTAEGIFNASDFKLQVSDDGSSWIDVDVVEGNRLSITDRDIALVTARYVRLYVSRPTSVDFNQNAVVYEFEVYGFPIERLR